MYKHIYIHIHTYTYTHTYIYIYIYVYIYTHTHTSMQLLVECRPSFSANRHHCVGCVSNRGSKTVDIGARDADCGPS